MLVIFSIIIMIIIILAYKDKIYNNNASNILYNHNITRRAVLYKNNTNTVGMFSLIILVLFSTSFVPYNVLTLNPKSWHKP
jgi:uncharacterized ion transporter superfamily protein YfcC